MPFDLTSNSSFLRTIQIYENEKQFYFIGTHSINKTLLVFTIKKLKFTSNNKGTFQLKDILIEHKKEYDKESFDELIVALNQDTSTQLRFVEEIKCIFGFVKFYFGYYAILVSEYSKVGKIGEFIINRVDKLKLLPLFYVNTTNVYLELESKYLAIFKNFDPTKQVYFSFTYDLTKTLQRNFVEKMKNELVEDYHLNFMKSKDDKLSNEGKDSNNNLIEENLPEKEKEEQKITYIPNLKNSTNNTFLWNHFHIKEFFNQIENKIWVTNFIYGFIEQVECINYGLRFLVTVIARRNRHFAGTRYLKRGINDKGQVANDVETEQILEEISTSCAEKPVISSYIHIRGSVPIYWYQEQSGIMPKPDIKVNYSDVFYESTKKHFNLLKRRYGSPIIVCNLTKKKEGDHKQEELLNDSYQDGIEYINNELKEGERINYLHFDLKSERRQSKFYSHFYEISYGLIEQTNMFYFIPYLRNNNTYTLQLQSGVIRSNCVDCLDRTNVFQQVIGTAVMVNQLRSMGVNANEPNNEEEMFGTLTELYKKMGHELSSQYAGSLAHKQTIKDNRTMMNKIIDKAPELFNTFKRYFNNSFNDQYKQASINLFLGMFKVGHSNLHLWDMFTDVALHRRENLVKLKNGWSHDAINYYTKYNLLDDIDLTIHTKDILNYITLTPTSHPNNYSINLQQYPKYKKINNQIKNINDIETFYSLDIDSKTQIKNFSKFSYNILNNNNNHLYSPHDKKNESVKSTPTNFNSSKISYNDTPIENENSQFDSPMNQIKRRYTKVEPNPNIRKTNKRHVEICNKKQSTDDYDDLFKQVDRPKYDLKITSFDIDANEINLVNEFVDPDPKYLQNSEYNQLDYFLGIEINNENYNKVFDQFDVTIGNNNQDIMMTNEYVEDFLLKMQNSPNKKKEHKLRELKNTDYLIFNVDEKQFYKKLKRNDEETISNGGSSNSSKVLGNLNTLSNINGNNTNSNQKLDGSPKIKVKVKKLPIKIFEDHL